jgi:glycosyltransferase involved in cell wall biosynthesis
MRIFVDTDCLYTAKTGVRTYVIELVRALKNGGHEVIELRRNPNSFFVKNQLKYKLLLHIGRILWTQFIIPLKLFNVRKKGDVLISPEYFTPYVSPVPNLLTIHDAVFVTRLDDYSSLFKWTLKIIAWPSARRASKILTVSEDAKEQISDKLNIEKGKIEVTYLGVKPFGLKVSKVEKYENEEFFLYVGVLEKRKNIPKSIEAFSEIKKKNPNVKFFIVGQPAPFPHLDDTTTIKNLIKDLNLQDSVVLLGYVTDEELSALYHNALALVFISTYEGFGLPIIEGYSAGIPVLTSKGGATEEVAGGCSLLCNASDVTDISEKMQKLIENPELRTSLVKRGKERAKHFTWDKMSQKITKVIKEL